MYQVSFNSLLYFQRHALDNLFIAKIKKGCNFVNTSDRVMVQAFCNFLHGPLSVYHLFIFNTLRDIILTILLLQKHRKGNNSVITCDRVTILASCISTDSGYQCIKFYLIPIYTFRDMLRIAFYCKKLRREVTP